MTSGSRAPNSCAGIADISQSLPRVLPLSAQQYRHVPKAAYWGVFSTVTGNFRATGCFGVLLADLNCLRNSPAVAGLGSLGDRRSDSLGLARPGSWARGVFLPFWLCRCRPNLMTFHSTFSIHHSTFPRRVPWLANWLVLSLSNGPVGFWDSGRSRRIRPRFSSWAPLTLLRAVRSALRATSRRLFPRR
jgi:hypothetical protein